MQLLLVTGIGPNAGLDFLCIANDLLKIVSCQNLNQIENLKKSNYLILIVNVDKNLAINSDNQ